MFRNHHVVEPASSKRHKTSWESVPFNDRQSVWMPELEHLPVHNFFTCRISMDERCYLWPWLSEVSGVVMRCFHGCIAHKTGSLVQPGVMGEETCELNAEVTRDSHATSQTVPYVFCLARHSHNTSQTVPYIFCSSHNAMPFYCPTV